MEILSCFKGTPLIVIAGSTMTIEAGDKRATRGGEGVLSQGRAAFPSLLPSSFCEAPVVVFFSSEGAGGGVDVLLETLREENHPNPLPPPEAAVVEAAFFFSSGVEGVGEVEDEVVCPPPSPRSSSLPSQLPY